MGENRRDLLEEAGRALGPLAEIIRQVRAGELTAKQIQTFTEHLNPFTGNADNVFERIMAKVLALENEIYLPQPNFDEELVKIVAQAIIAARPPQLKRYRVVVDYDQSRDKIIKAGKYDEINDWFTDKHFAISGNGQHQVDLGLVDWDIVQKGNLNNQKWTSAKVEHLLAFGAAFPEVQRKFAIIAHDSPVSSGGNRGYPELLSRGSERWLFIRWRDSFETWDKNCRFLVVLDPADK